MIVDFESVPLGNLSNAPVSLFLFFIRGNVLVEMCGIVSLESVVFKDVLSKTNKW